MSIKSTNISTPALCALALALCGSSAVSWAQSVSPNAGQLLQELPQQPLAPLPKTGPLVPSEEKDGGRDANERKFMVKEVAISGNESLPTAELQALVDELLNTERSLSQLNKVARRITAYYRQQGFPVARAYLPEQDITDGKIQIAIVEGRVAGHKLSNQSRLSDGVAKAYVAEVRDGDVIRSAKLERGLLLLQDTPGVGVSRATLQPGASPGTSELLLDLQPAALFSGNVMFDNYGSRYTGTNRVSANLNVASPLHIGDQLAVSGLRSSNGGMEYARIAYQLPLGSDGLRVGLAYFDLQYALGKEYASLEAQGSATSTTLYASYPWLRSPFANLNSVFSVEDKHLQDDVKSTSTFTGKHVQVMNFALAGNRQDALGGGGVNGLDLGFTHGRLNIQSPSALAIDAASAQTEGDYNKLSFGANRRQWLGSRTTLVAALNGQQAGKNLDSSEKFSLGGPTTVRAYPTSEAIGDSGYFTSLEVQQNLLQGVQGSVFYDRGTVKFNQHQYDSSSPNERTLAGAGFGLNAMYSRVSLRASMAWRTSDSKPTSIPASSVKSTVIYFQMSLAL